MVNIFIGVIAPYLYSCIDYIIRHAKTTLLYHELVDYVGVCTLGSRTWRVFYQIRTIRVRSSIFTAAVQHSLQMESNLTWAVDCKIKERTIKLQWYRANAYRRYTVPMPFHHHVGLIEIYLSLSLKSGEIIVN